MRRRGIMGVSKGRLPSEYQEVEYIQTHGEQRINTLLVIDGFIAIMDLEFQDVVTPQLFCAHYISHADYFQVSGGYADAESGLKIPVSADIRYTIICEAKKGGCPRLTVGDTTISGYNTVSQPYNRPTYILGFKYNQNTWDTYCKAYSIKCYDGETLVRDFVPCYRIADGEIGMYDLCESICPLTNTPLYINSGTGTFTKGADI